MPKILVVEDDPLQRLLYRGMLEDEGYEVVGVSNSQEALATIKENQPDIVVLDINMPGMDGLEALTQIHDLNRNVPVILHTAHAFYETRFVSWIADAYVVKSSRLDKLIETIQETLMKRKFASSGEVDH